MSLAKLYLKKNEEKRIKGGHLWIYSNEVDTQQSPLKQFASGETVEIVQHSGKSLGIGYINPNNLLCARLLSRDPQVTIDKSFFVHRFNIALSLRQRIYDKPFYRLVFGEGDELPGLIVDRFGEHLVVQITTAGMERYVDDICQALEKVCKPQSILLRNDSNARDAESLSRENRQAFGVTPASVIIEENNTEFAIHPFDGQKTGWFYDHRSSRQQINQYVKGKRVLDVFSYIGAFGIQALKHQASELWAVDISAKALDELEHNATLNQCDDKLTTIEGDALTALKQLKQNGEKFDVVIVDPPAFIKRKKDHKAGLNAYRKINEAAMRLLERDGILLTASCSMHLKSSELLDIVRSAGRHLEKRVQIIEQCHQGVDHPIHPAIAETQYIKGYICRVLSA
ncbi:MAG: class I SAM-dependent rRNA methyltransferase [Gammaproteobacteria bacterium]|nr:class I SAM-dependent rRNA methyltransferase [Gammaproteobacteria bacterium]NVK86784.1 class I SAM-dependent rRNA methyltransferase [Gammaproteobacteria bacterium]